MKQHKLVITCDKDTAFAVSDLFDQIEEPSFDAVSLVLCSDESWQVECYSSSPVASERLSETISAALQLNADALQITAHDIPDIDWVSKVQSDLKPVVTGGFMVHGSHDRDVAETHPCPIEIDAGQAFGTAHHGTTAGCLDALSRILEETSPKNVLDLGTGSGVLAIAAAKRLPDAQVVGSDIDEISVTVARENAALNKTDQIEFVCADGLDTPQIARAAPFDLIFANILAKPLMEMAPDIVKATEGGGVIIISGLLNEQASSVAAEFESAGCVMSQRLDREEWSTLILKRSQAT